MKINEQIRTTLKTFGIPEDDGVAYLLSIYFNCRPSYTPPSLVQRINITHILGISPEKELRWDIPLFEDVGVHDKWDWVKEWNAHFGVFNKKRKGTDATCIIRMKAFFADNPDVRKEEVYEATKLYFGTLTDAQYLISSHYFISKGVGRDRESALLSWVEKYREQMKNTIITKNVDIGSQMQ